MIIALLDALRTRLLPAFVTAMGVVLVTAGLFSYADPATAGTAVVEPPTIETLAPTEEPTATIEVASPSAGPSASASADPSPTPTPTTFVGRAVATRVVIPALRIDLPVVKGNADYPYCDVAMYIKELGQPGEGRATYIYAHARDGMFGPIYELAIPGNKPRAMLGMIVQVYTSDDRLYLYEIHEVRRHQLDLERAQSATTEELWLQTSEGPKGTPGKTQLIARLLSVGQADPKDAHPKAKPVACG
ncbi:MAG: sortase domain-containing protein [Candidatus Limnocylindrales bacterium]